MAAPRPQSGLPSRRGSSSTHRQTDWFIDPISARAVRTARYCSERRRRGLHVGGARRPQGDALFDAGGLFVYDDDDHWAKLAVEMTGAGPTIVSVVTDFSDDCNSTVLGQSRPAATGARRAGDRLFTHPAAAGAGVRPGLPSAERGATRSASSASADRRRVCNPDLPTRSPSTARSLSATLRDGS
jgi:hypothetical protein